MAYSYDPKNMLTSKINSNVRNTARLLWENRAKGGWPRMWIGSGWRPGSREHSTGRAVDFIMSDEAGTKPNRAELDSGWAFVQYMWRNRKALGVYGIIWQNRILGYSWPSRGWRKYTAGGSTVSGKHLDHVHVLFKSSVPRVNALPGLKAASSSKSTKKTTTKKTTTVVVTLRKGSKGTAVRKLQAGLNKVFPAYKWRVSPRGRKLATDGIFGPHTERWVREFQKRAGVGVDGIVGPKTRAALKRYGISI